MCMIYHIGTEQPVPLIPWNPDAPAVCTKSVSEQASSVVQHFSLPNVTYVGSSQSCGCGIRYAMWKAPVWIPLLNPVNDSQRDHEALVSFIRLHATGPYVEIYACWDGDYADAPESSEEIDLERILEKDFMFKERGFYRIKREANQGMGITR